MRYPVRSVNCLRYKRIVVDLIAGSGERTACDDWCYDSRVLRDRSHHPSPSSVREAGAAYTRKEVCRLLKIDNRQLKAWEHQQLIPEREQFSFADLLSLKRIVRLRSEKAPTRQIKKALDRVRAL